MTPDKGLHAAKPLLAAAIKARAQANGAQRAMKAEAGNGEDNASDDDGSGGNSSDSSKSDSRQLSRKLPSSHLHLNLCWSIESMLMIPAYLRLERPMSSTACQIAKDNGKEIDEDTS